ncbi:uncharacterized protein LOC123551415 isoform X2 [Mercenaria mercenaria]|nr:uncharacterized protein LOC123551415 isoform X2 [Mercenaria mercenaria]
MARELLVIVTLFVFLAEYASGEVCEQTYSVKTSSNQNYYAQCGWWGWNRCQRSRTVYKLETRTRQLCCAGSYGSVATGCVGVCPYSDAQSSSACPGNRVCRDYQCDASGVNASSLPTPAALTFNENDDQERLLWTVDGQCFVQESCPCARRRRETDEKEREKRATCTCSKTVPCTHCTVQSTNGIAAVRNGIEIYRKACNQTCRDCSRYPGCLDNKVNYVLAVECRASGYIYNGAVQQSFILNVTEAPAPIIEVDPGNLLVLDTGAKVGDTLLTIGDIIIADSEKVTYSVEGPVSVNTGEPLFGYNETSKKIIVNSDLSEEQSAVYTLQFCVEHRRGATCVELVVKIDRMTTTTTQAPTTQPEDEAEYMCMAADSWKLLPGMDWWCNSICGKLGNACPYLDTHCICQDIASEHLNCRGGGLYADAFYMDVWCDLNCNMGIYSNCPTNTSQPAYCVCN